MSVFIIFQEGENHKNFSQQLLHLLMLGNDVFLCWRLKRKHVAARNCRKFSLNTLKCHERAWVYNCFTNWLVAKENTKHLCYLLKSLCFRILDLFMKRSTQYILFVQSLLTSLLLQLHPKLKVISLWHWPLSFINQFLELFEAIN